MRASHQGAQLASSTDSPSPPCTPSDEATAAPTSPITRNSPNVAKLVSERASRQPSHPDRGPEQPQVAGREPATGQTSEQDSQNAAPGMRAAVDIAKRSIPSLSSLQYLPGRLALKPGRPSGKRPQDDSNDDKKADEMPRGQGGAQVRSTGALAAQQLEQPSATAPSPAQRIAKQPDDSCLLHRLCLCNCMSRGHNNVKRLRPQAGEAARETSPQSSSPGTVPESSKCARVKSALAPGDERSPGANNPRLAAGPTGPHQGERDLAGASQDMNVDAGVNETSAQACREAGPVADLEVPSGRKSPALLDSLLRPGRRFRGPEAHRHTLESAIKMAREEPREPVNGPVRAFGVGSRRRLFSALDSDCSGSIGDRAISGRSSASDSLASGCSPSPSPSSESGPGPANRTETELGDSELAANTDQATRETGDSHRNPPAKRVPAYRKFLSPKRLFTSSASSECDNDDKHTEQRSFLSRSLSRLSGRRRRATALTKPHKQSNDQQERPASRASTTGRNSIDDSQADTLSCSTNSLEEIHLSHLLPHSLREPDKSSTTARLSTVPNIVLSRVALPDHHKDCACVMPDADDANRDYRPVSALPQGDRRINANGRSKHLHGSELSFDVSDNSDSCSHLRGPLSLPGSPHSGRRYRSRSPRLSQSPVPFQSPPVESTRIEDGLKVCSNKNFEKHIDTIKLSQIEAQKKLFTAWINHFVPNLIRHDLFVELQDGIKLIGLLAALTHDKEMLAQYERLNHDKNSYVDRLRVTPSSRLKHLSNVSIALDYMRTKLGMKLVGLNPMDIVNGKANVILGLCWTMILNFQLDQFLKSSVTSSDHSSEMSNWLGYVQARNELKDWLMLAETKLIEALKPLSDQNPAAGDETNANLIDRHMSRLDDLVEFFELRPIDVEEDFRLDPTNELPSLNSHNGSLTGSMVSLGSSGSRLSTLTSSEKPTYHLMYENFELKCRQLAAMLEHEQREALLLGVRELKTKLKYITDFKVPQVIGEIRMSISRCEMSIKEQDELQSDFEGMASELSPCSENSNCNEAETSPSPELTPDDVPIVKEADNPVLGSRTKAKVKKSSTRRRKSKLRHSQRDSSSKSGREHTEVESKLPNKKTVDDGDNSFIRMLWSKIVKASKMSLSLNIVLLVCLAGICVVPLIQRDACCELDQAQIPADRFTVNQKPT